MNPATNCSAPLVATLMKADSFDHPVEQIQLVETHISWVILTGPYAYKIKRPVDLGFADFSTLEKRRFYCEEEIRLNRRLAPEIYLEVVPITGNPAAVRFAGKGEAIEYAVKMVQFPQESQLDEILKNDALTPLQIDAFAGLIAAFHHKIDRADPQSLYGDCEHLSQPVFENFRHIRKHITDRPALDCLEALETRSCKDIDHLQPLFGQRKEEGFIRECHGDLHLANMAWFKEKPLVFDCIEFNPNLRWIDVISEVAFLVMDLEKRGHSPLAYRFLNAYLERTGDYGALRLLTFYLIYRVLVRAKVEAIRSGQPETSREEATAHKQAFGKYLQLAVRYTDQRRLRVIVTHGLSGSGKSTLTQKLAERLGAIRVRSDVERKRLFGLNAEDNGQSGFEQNIYSSEASERTYNKLSELAALILEGGFTVIIDAACLKIEQRKRFQALASANRFSYHILEVTASEASLRQRIVERSQDASDADLKVLEYQMKSVQPLQPDEIPHAITVDTEATLDIEKLANQF